MQETQETWVLSLSWEDPLETSDPVLVAPQLHTLELHKLVYLISKKQVRI